MYQLRRHIDSLKDILLWEEDPSDSSFLILRSVLYGKRYYNEIGVRRSKTGFSTALIGESENKDELIGIAALEML